MDIDGINIAYPLNRALSRTNRQQPATVFAAKKAVGRLDDQMPDERPNPYPSHRDSLH